MSNLTVARIVENLSLFLVVLFIPAHGLLFFGLLFLVVTSCLSSYLTGRLEMEEYYKGKENK